MTTERTVTAATLPQDDREMAELIAMMAACYSQDKTKLKPRSDYAECEGAD